MPEILFQQLEQAKNLNDLKSNFQQDIPIWFQGKGIAKKPALGQREEDVLGCVR